MIINRWFIYLNEVFKPFSRILFSAILTLGLLFTLQVRYNEDTLVIGKSAVIGTITIFLFLLYYRLCDEFKDFDTDKKYFPERPVPSGRVSLNDLNYLIYIITILLFVINFYFKVNFLSFLAFLSLYFFGFMMGKWFFLPSLISNNRIWAFITHSPVSLVVNFYIINLFVAEKGLALFTLDNFLIALWWAIPGWGWEIARKTYEPESERSGYQTYSMMLGYKLAGMIPIFLMLIQFFILFQLRVVLHLSPITIFISLGIISITSIFFIRFIFLATKKSSNVLRLSMEVYSFLIYACLLCDLFFTKRQLVW
ncbi:MAG: UbiA family prenyltransferase [Oligoflexia bacterium]|nr:UbiA family prenyltransferase [Oligoflexia bacterium]